MLYSILMQDRVRQYFDKIKDAEDPAKSAYGLFLDRTVIEYKNTL